MKYEEQKIDDYIFNRMGKDQRAAFQFEMINDPALKKEVDTRRALQKIARSANTSPPGDNGGRLKWSALLAVVLIGVLAFLLFKQSQPTEKPKTAPSIIKNKTEIETKELVPNSIREEKKSDPVPPKEEEKKEVVPKNPEKKKEPPRAIAQRNPADFSTNDYLENFIGSGVRSGDISVDMEMADKFYLKNNSTEIKINGSVIAEQEPDLTLHIFSNKEKDYEDFQPKLTTELNLIKDENTGNEFRFSVPLKVDFKEGLYYVIIETTEDGEMVVVDKFMIDNL